MQDVEIIAEAAQGFEGNPQVARLLVRGAASAGADAVKFQLVYADELATPAYAYYGLFKQLEMPNSEWQSVAEEASRAKIRLLFDVFGPRSLALACELGAGVKLHSTDFFNERLLEAALAQASRVYVSIGGILVEEIEALLRKTAGSRAKPTIMFGYQAEPTNVSDNHLSRLPLLIERFADVPFGFMDHAEGGADEAEWLGIMAVALGARVIEKHITLDRALQMEDYVSALSSSELARYVRRLRQACIALGVRSLELSEPERAYRERSVKVVVVDREIRAGDRFDVANLSMRRAPIEAGKQPLRDLAQVVGRRASRSIAAEQPVHVEDVE